MTRQTKNALIVGGTSGLGFELGTAFAKDYNVTITGRHDPHSSLTYHHLDMSAQQDLRSNLETLLKDTGKVDLLVYAAGFYQEGTIDRLSDEDIVTMTNVGLLAPAYLLKKILANQDGLDGFIAITSTSQWTPREYEPMYTAVKSGLAMFANSISKDTRVKKTFVAAPAGMDTSFWKDGRDVGQFLKPAEVAQAIEQLYADDFRYRFAKFLRYPLKVDIVETRS